MYSLAHYISLALVLFTVYVVQQVLRPFITLYLNYKRAQTIGLPIKVNPVPQGLFSFFAFQLFKKLPFPRLHAMLNMGRPDGYGMHAELGDVFVIVNPMGISLCVADAAVASYVGGHRCEFPKPPNTGAIINIYGRNVINADGDVWRFHRRVTGPVFSERIHRNVWDHAREQCDFMMATWNEAGANMSTSEKEQSLLTPPASPTRSTDGMVVRAPLEDLLRLGMHVITSAAYGVRLAWKAGGDAPVDPPCTVRTALTYRQSLDQVTAYLMSIFLTPHWLLRLAPADSTWGRAWTAYTAFGGYMRGMLERERELQRIGRGEDDENLLTVLVRAQDEDQKEGRRMTDQEVMGNAFIYLFAGHETTANTMHYALLSLALNPDVQDILLAEIDRLYARAAAEGRTELEYDIDYPRATWALAVMYETLRVYTPTGITNKWTATAQPIIFQGRTYIIPAHTKIMVNGTGVHFNPSVWGEDASVWRPERWVDDDPALISRAPSRAQSRAPSPVLSLAPPPSLLSVPNFIPAARQRDLEYLTPPPSPTPEPPSSPTAAVGVRRLRKSPRGAFLPFSEGTRACSGRKFAAVEFVAVFCNLLRNQRVEVLSAAEGWGPERARKVLAGRKAGALTLTTPEHVPVRFVRR